MQRTTMFRDVDVAKLKLIAMAGQRVQYEPGDVILREGDRSAMVFVLMEGEAEIFRNANGKQIKLASAKAGEMVGEVGVVLDQPYAATIKAVTLVIALQIDDRTFLELLKEVPQLSIAVIRDLARRVIAASDRYIGALS